MVVEVVLKILAIISGEYGKRHVANIQKHGPDDWEIEAWQAPAILPPVIDYPEDYLPEQMPAADLILSFAEHKGVAELLPDIAGMTGAQAVLVAVDNEAWLPRGLARQLKGWLSAMQVACATPKPLCTLTESDYKITRRKRETYTSPLISEFARYFGQPDLKITVDPETRTISAAQVRRDAVCGCIRYVAEKLIGVSVDEAEEKAGLLHHHYPCLASMVKLDDYNHDTLMHESGHMLRDNINEQIKPFKDTQYISPGERSE
jgi:thymidylate synthase